MTTLMIDRKGAEISYHNGALQLRLPDKPPRNIPLRRIKRLIIAGSANLDTAILNQCWERKISVLLLTGRRRNMGAHFFGNSHNDATLRVAQILSCTNEEHSTQAAKKLVKAKIVRQYRLLKQLSKTRDDGKYRAKAGLKAISTSYKKLEEEQNNIDIIRGLEGAAALGYFKSYCRFFAPSLNFNSRRRRPPPDPVNAALSLAYTIATFESGRAANLAGLDPYIGCLHSLAYNRPSLALDIVEPLRPIVDAMVFELFNKRILTADHFTKEGNNSFLLGKAGRAHFYETWEEKYAPKLRRRAKAQARILRDYFLKMDQNIAKEIRWPLN